VAAAVAAAGKKRKCEEAGMSEPFTPGSATAMTAVAAVAAEAEADEPAPPSTLEMEVAGAAVVAASGSGETAPLAAADTAAHTAAAVAVSVAALATARTEEVALAQEVAIEEAVEQATEAAAAATVKQLMRQAREAEEAYCGEWVETWPNETFYTLLQRADARGTLSGRRRDDDDDVRKMMWQRLSQPERSGCRCEACCGWPGWCKCERSEHPSARSHRLAPHPRTAPNPRTAPSHRTASLTPCRTRVRASLSCLPASLLGGGARPANAGMWLPRLHRGLWRLHSP
jgi:hypothetical protein